MPRTPHAIPNVDPLELIDQIEMCATRDDDPYWRWVKELTDASMATSNVDEAEDAELLQQTHAGYVIAQASRYAGFAIGFRYATRLLQGEEGSAAPFPKERVRLAAAKKATSSPSKVRPSRARKAVAR